MRVTSSLWVGAYLRQCFAQGVMAAVVRRGASDAGAIFIKLNRLDGTFDLYGPAPQTVFDDARPDDRIFEQLFAAAEEAEIDGKIDRERSFDPDVWVLEIEDRDGRHLLQLSS